MINMEFKELIGKTLKNVAIKNNSIEFITTDDVVYAIRIFNPITSELKVTYSADINVLLMSPITEAYDISGIYYDHYNDAPSYRNHYFVIGTKKGSYTFDFFDYSDELCKFGKVISSQNFKRYYQQDNQQDNPHD